MIQKRPDPDVSREIDENLRKVYEDVLKEEIPERFKELLKELRAEQVSHSDASSQEDR